MPTVLTVDHDLYFAVVEYLADRDEGDSKFAFENAHLDFVEGPAFRAAYEAATGESLSRDRIREAHMFVAAVSLVHHHNWNTRFYREQVAEQPEAVSAFIATAGFTFLTAWTQRYGALEGDRYSAHLVTPHGYEAEA